jgi:hypothetical protein
MSMPMVERVNPTSDELVMLGSSGMVKIQRIKFLANSNLVNEKFIAFNAYKILINNFDLHSFTCHPGSFRVVPWNGWHFRTADHSPAGLIHGRNPWQ